MTISDKGTASAVMTTSDRGTASAETGTPFTSLQAQPMTKILQNSSVKTQVK